MSAHVITSREVAVLLQINTVGDATLTDGFTKQTVCGMFGWSFTPKDILILEQDGVEVLSIPWPDGLTLDQALLAWAESVQNAASWRYGPKL